MDETLQDSIVAAPQNKARDDDAWLAPVATPADAPDPLAGSTRDFLTTVAKKPTDRAEAFWRWNHARIEHGGFPYGKALAQAPKPTTALRFLSGDIRSGLNFSSQEYLSLASHPQIIAAATEAMHRLGVHSAGSTALGGNLIDGQALEAELGDWLQTRPDSSE